MTWTTTPGTRWPYGADEVRDSILARMNRTPTREDKMIDFLPFLTRLSPLNGKRNESLAAIIGFLFGGIGLAIYLRSVVDGLLPLLIVLVMPSLGVDSFSAILIGGIIAALWGYFRVQDSNQRQPVDAVAA